MRNKVLVLTLLFSAVAYGEPSSREEKFLPLVGHWERSSVCEVEDRLTQARYCYEHADLLISIERFHARHELLVDMFEGGRVFPLFDTGSSEENDGRGTFIRHIEDESPASAEEQNAVRVRTQFIRRGRPDQAQFHSSLRITDEGQLLLVRTEESQWGKEAESRTLRCWFIRSPRPGDPNPPTLGQTGRVPF